MAIPITGTFKPLGDFPLVVATDVEMPDGSRLSDQDFGGGLPEVSEADNGKIFTVVNGELVLVPVADSSVKTYIDGQFVPITQEGYDALVAAGTLDKTKYYIIVGDSE